MKKFSLLTFLLLVFVLSGCQSQPTENQVNRSLNSAKKQTTDLRQLGEDIPVLTQQFGAKTLSEEAKEDKQANNDQKNKMNVNQAEGGNDDSKEKLPIKTELGKTCREATIITNFGEFKIKFFNKQTPLTVANFCTLARKGFYDNLTFHRIIKNFMIQGGDPKGNGTGGPGYTFKDEIGANNHNRKYTIAMANAGPNTNGSQFFINTNDNDFLDKKHTVFGQVISGQEVIDKIENLKTDQKDKPLQKVIIKKIELVIEPQE